MNDKDAAFALWWCCIFFFIVKYVYFIQKKKGRREGFMDAWHRGGTEGIFVG